MQTYPLFLETTFQNRFSLTDILFCRHFFKNDLGGFGKESHMSGRTDRINNERTTMSNRMYLGRGQIEGDDILMVSDDYGYGLVWGWPKGINSTTEIVREMNRRIEAERRNEDDTDEGLTDEDAQGFDSEFVTAVLARNEDGISVHVNHDTINFDGRFGE